MCNLYNIATTSPVVGKRAEGQGGLTKNDLFAFMTTEPNGIVGPIHQTQCRLTGKDEVETWLTKTKPWQEAKALQRSLPDDRLVIAQEPETQVIARQQRGW